MVAEAVQVEQEQEGFLVQQAVFTGTLGELAHALRTTRLKPQDIDVLKLVQDYLEYFDELAKDDLNLASEALPSIARVVELKLRFLLPRPPKDEEDLEEELLEQALEAVNLLEELEDAILFLRERRAARRIMLKAKTPRPDYPRLERPIKIELGKLAELASRFSLSNYFEMAIERMTMASAMKQLMANLRRLRRGRLRDLAPHQTWSVMTITFAGMLELFKEGKLKAVQHEPYGDIEIEMAEEQRQQDAA